MGDNHEWRGNAKVLSGTRFDWDEAKQYADNVVDKNGDVNWRNAFWADPGVMSCPKCGAMYWAEGHAVECTGCGERWYTCAPREGCAPPLSCRLEHSDLALGSGEGAKR